MGVTTQAWHGTLEKIDDYRWRIPQSYDPGMRVPGLIFADEKLLRDITTDQSLQQVANVAHLPGIVAASLAMPDIHWGYGFPIGGVAATDPNQGGVVSPGGVGFDINCLSGDTLVLHRWGYSRRIADIVQSALEDPVRCYQLNTHETQAGPVVAGRCQPPATSVLQLRTQTGRCIKATSDHSFLTPFGMRPLGALVRGDRIAVDSFEGVPYEPPSQEVLISENGVRRLMCQLGKTGGHAVDQVVGYLRERDLLPLRYDSDALPVLTKLLGVVTGDGVLYFERGNGKGMIWLYGRPEDLQAVRQDLAGLFQVSALYQRDRTHRIEADYGRVEFSVTEHSCRISSTGCALLLVLLGCPLGNKAIQDFDVPAWLGKAPLWLKRLFLSSYFGAELQAPRPYKIRNRNFPCPLLTVQKLEGHVESGRRFLTQIADLVHQFGVETLGIEERRETVRRTRGISHRLRLMFSSQPASLMALYQRIGFEYNRKRSAEAAIVAAYHALKQSVWSGRQESLAEIVALRQSHGCGAKRIADMLAGRIPNGQLHVNRRFIERTLYGRADRAVRVHEGFLSYEAFKANATEGLEGSGMVWEEIERITSCSDVTSVYDITVAHPDHNFVANGFIVHNCGVRLMRTDLDVEDVTPKLQELIPALFNTIPTGVGMRGDIRFTKKDAPRVMTQGARWAISHGYGVPEDLAHTESQGALEGADPETVSERAVQRGQDQLGTLGSGNHFLEVQAVETIFNPEMAEALGLRQGQVMVMMHSGSRGFGYQICDDSLDIMEGAMQRYGIHVPDRQLACAPVTSPEGQRYLGAIRCAANFAWANRQCLMHLARAVFERVFGQSWRQLGMTLIYDVAHNIAKFERHRVDGTERTVCVHRKGATRAFPPGHPEIPAEYRDVGQPVIIPGDMGRYSFVLVGTAEAMAQSFGTVCHGAGRMMSRAEAVRRAAGRSIERELAQQGIIVMGRGRRGIAEEQPSAYKDVNDVVHVVHHAGLAKRVARLRPLGVIKG